MPSRANTSATERDDLQERWTRPVALDFGDALSVRTSPVTRGAAVDTMGCNDALVLRTRYAHASDLEWPRVVVMPKKHYFTNIYLYVVSSDQYMPK